MSDRRIDQRQNGPGGGGRRGRRTSGEVSPRNGGHWDGVPGSLQTLARACVTNTSVPTVGRSGISADTAHSSVPQKLSCGGSATAPTIPTTSRSSDRSADTPTPPRSNHRVAPLRRRHRRIKSAAARPHCAFIPVGRWSGVDGIGPGAGPGRSDPIPICCRSRHSADACGRRNAWRGERRPLVPWSISFPGKPLPRYQTHRNGAADARHMPARSASQWFFRRGPNLGSWPGQRTAGEATLKPATAPTWR